MTLEARLRIAGIAFGVGSTIHIIDHLRRGQGSVSETLSILGTSALVLQVVVVTLIVVRHHIAPLVALGAGWSLAVGFAAAHWLPRWSEISDPVWEIESQTWYSYIASTTEIAAAIAIALAGGSIVRRDGLAHFATGTTAAAG